MRQDGMEMKWVSINAALCDLTCILRDGNTSGTHTRALGMEIGVVQADVNHLFTLQALHWWFFILTFVPLHPGIPGCPVGPACPGSP